MPLNLHFGITDGVDDEYKGTISLKHIDYKKKCAEFAIVLIKSAHNKGIAKNALMKLLNMLLTN